MSCNLIKKVKSLVLCINNNQTNMRTGPEPPLTSLLCSALEQGSLEGRRDCGMRVAEAGSQHQSQRQDCRFSTEQ